MRRYISKHLPHLAIGVGAAGTLLGGISVLVQAGRVDWGDAPTWLGVVFAAAAGVAALLLLRTESRRDTLADTDRRARELESRQAQAVLVCAWHGSTEFDPVAFASGAQSPILGHIWGAFIRNASQLPVYEVRTTFFYDGEGVAPEERGVVVRQLVPPSFEPQFVAQGGDLRRPSRVDPDGNPVMLEARNRFLVTIEFTDAAGRRWLRGLDGRLIDLG